MKSLFASLLLLYDRIRTRVSNWLDLPGNEALKRNLLNALPFWIGAVLTGAVAVLYAKLFSWAEDAARWCWQQAAWSFFILSPLAFLFARRLVARKARFAAGSGIPQVTAAIELATARQYPLVNALLSMRILVVKILSSLMMVMGGGLVGREGPTIQISASIFKKVNDLLPEWYPKVSRRNMVVTGAAAGLAAAFNTPLGGIVFAIEELTKTHFNFFKSALLTGVIISGLTALNFLGPYLYLGYPKLTGIHSWALALVLPVAAITGMAGSGLGRLILFLSARKRRLRLVIQHDLYAVVAGLLIATAIYYLGTVVMGSGKEIMVDVLFTADKSVEWYVPIVRILGSAASFTTGAAGGVFAPSLSAGAAIGAVVSGWLHLSPADTNLMVLCGMAGFLTGITRSPFTTSILVLEMTDTHSVIFHIMLTTLVANLMAGMIHRTSLYEALKEQYLRDAA